MRIIGGTYKGLRVSVPRGLPVRPTTDMAREALFNLLVHRFDFDRGIRALDLFSGTGGISLELASRGASSVTAVDRHAKCIRFLSATASELGIDSIRTVRSDVFSFLDQCTDLFDIVFADPPYDLDRLPQLPSIILDKNILVPGGLFILEFPSTLTLPGIPVATQVRKYGNSSFAIYEAPQP